jgi:DNA-directed RNA polymerase specialized sigma24 family protein
MRIINPLYDLAFKYLMQNERYAKRVLSVILELEVDDVHLEQQETVYNDDRRNLRLFRLDFKATIRDMEGNKSTVLIELQKSKYDTDIERFRNYLGMSYMSRYPDLQDQQESISQVSEDTYQPYSGIHPIISIYILGYNLDDLPYLAVTVNRDVIDSVTKEKIQSESFFVTHLTHRSHIIQVKRLPKERRSRLEKFLMFFNQAWCREKGYIIELQEIPTGFEDMAQYLQAPLLDENFRRKLEAEDQIDRVFNKKEEQLMISEKLREEAEKREEQIRTHLSKAIKKMLSRGFTITEIAEDLGIPEEEVKSFAE